MVSLRIQRIVGIGMLVSFLGAAMVLAQDSGGAGPRAEAANQTVVKMYRVGELVELIKNFPLDPPPLQFPQNTGGGNIFPDRVTTRQQRMQDIIRLIETVIEADTWKDQGGVVGSISTLSSRSMIVVLHTPAVHKRIGELLDQLRHELRLDASITIDAHWVMATTEQAAKWRAGEAVGLDILKDPKALHSCARAMAMDAQTVSVAGGQLATEVTAAQPVTSENVAAMAFTTDQARLGIGLEITPRLSEDRHWLIVDVSSTVTERTGGKEATRPAQRLGGDLDILYALEKPPHQEQKLTQTVRLPLGTPKFVGGMTLEPGKTDGKELCLILTGRIVEADDQKAADGSAKGK